MRSQIDADADHDDDLRSCARRLALRQDARALGLADQDIVGPLEPQARRSGAPAAAAIASITATPASSESWCTTAGGQASRCSRLA